MTQQAHDPTSHWFHPAVRSIVILLFAVVIAYKLITTPFNLTIDFPSLLSLLLAVFSVGLAALFYFKATETSNTFYDNTYRFTRDTAELLARIESGFGERLRHLDESYARIQDRFLPVPSKEEIARTEQDIEAEREALAATIREREKIIEDLLRKSKLDEKAKEEFREQLATRDDQLRAAQEQLNSLLVQVRDLKSPPEETARRDRRTAGVTEYLRTRVARMLDPEFIANAPARLLNRRWSAIRDTLPPAFLRDLEVLGLADEEGAFTSSGIRLLKQAAREAPDQTTE